MCKRFSPKKVKCAIYPPNIQDFVLQISSVPEGMFFVRGGAIRFSEDFWRMTKLYFRTKSVNCSRIHARHAPNMHQTCLRSKIIALLLRQIELMRSMRNT